MDPHRNKNVRLKFITKKSVEIPRGIFWNFLQDYYIHHSVRVIGFLPKISFTPKGDFLLTRPSLNQILRSWENDHQLKKLLIVKQILLVRTSEVTTPGVTFSVLKYSENKSVLSVNWTYLNLSVVSMKIHEKKKRKYTFKF